MSKAILVMDMPETCFQCKMQRILGMSGKIVCGAVSKNCEADHKEKKPDWCLLKEIPQKYSKSQEWFSEEYTEGRNDCIDEILKGSD